MQVLASELASYQDEPKQLATGGLGKEALLRLRFEARAERSILAFMERKAPLLVQKALYCDEGMPDTPVVYIITTSGGLVQGDRYTVEFDMRPRARAHVTTQAATKIHEMDANYAAQTQEFLLDDGAYLEYLPEPIIPSRHSRFHSRTRVRIAESATLLYAETLLAGRLHYREGERFQFDVYSSSVSAERPEGAKLFTEKLLIEPEHADVRNIGVMGNFNVFGSVVLLTPREHAAAIQQTMGAQWSRAGEWADGASRLPNDAGLVYRVVAADTQTARERIRAFWKLVRLQVAGCPVANPFPWR
ncbi:urease accessory protein UreD [Ramlibacter solisilvae]|uniref:Urease accessory protein UreD n=1 Tax=Ramlibacter tataouinensis TaxID=94132 RepID=A0A127JVZ9_9BURK|nr:urease accessory protein UreD [Ramlibacter tataouinensis]AMO24053.1 urease accessory protein UreD [Ramlibacter tataouinensis]